MDKGLIEAYLSQVDQILIQEPQDQVQIFHLIDQFLQNSQGDSNLEAFFKGERAFFNRQYKLALKYYASARSVPNFRFFCHRATAYAFKNGGRVEEAISFAKKALDVYPSDQTTLNAFRDLLRQKEGDDLPAHQAVSLAKKEIDELSDIFSDQASFQEDMEAEGSFLGQRDVSEEEFYPLQASNQTFEQSLDEDTAQVRDENFSEQELFFRQQKEALDKDLEFDLEQRVKDFQQKQSRLISQYVQKSTEKETLKEDCLSILNGWNYHQEKEQNTTELANFLFPEYRRKTSGGLYIRWNGQGIVINPGMNFLENFHQAGLYVKDIDRVIVTKDSMEAYADLTAIYDLNYQHNTFSKELHVIDYYLNQKAYDMLLSSLKPHFKQERNTVHCLELFLDSPEEEAFDLGEGIRLHYFRPQKEQSNDCIGIRLELEKEQGKTSLGFCSGIAWSEALGKAFQGVDVLVGGFEKTSSSDYQKERFNLDSLGYYGTYQLAKTVEPKLFLISEFSGNEGDIRLELAKKLRKELRAEGYSDLVLLPADLGLEILLDSLRLRCSISEQFVDAAKVVVAKSALSFSSLRYLSPAAVLC